MLTIRMQRTGRSGHAMFRVIVQDSRKTPTSGSIVAQLGSYDPHAKTIILNKEKAAFYLEHGAQPSDGVVRLLKKEGVKLPSWVKEPTKKERAVRNPDKRRSTAPEKPVEEVATAEVVEPQAPSEEPAEEVAEATDAEVEVSEVEVDAEVPSESEDKPTEEPTPEA